MGTLKIDLKSIQANLDGVFAAGDVIRGLNVAWAIRDGRDAASPSKNIYKQKKIK